MTRSCATFSTRTETIKYTQLHSIAHALSNNAKRGRTQQRWLVSSVSVSAQDGIVALGKAHTRSAPSLGSLPKVALETVPIFAWLNTDRSRPLRVECRPLAWLVNSDIPAERKIIELCGSRARSCDAASDEVSTTSQTLFFLRETFCKQ